MIKLLLALAAGLVAGETANVESPYIRAQALIALPDGRRINLFCTGRGSPTVVLEGGWTTDTSYWRKVQPLLAARSQVCSYDRAGYGFSDPGPLPRTAAAIEHDFAEMIDASPIRGRIILVAHSLGSFPARLYVDQHPEQVAGLVLLDPPTEDDRAFLARRGPSFDPAGFVDAALACSAAVIADPQATPDPPICLSSPSPTMPEAFNRMRSARQATAAYQRTAASEVQEMYGASAEEVRASHRWFGTIPLVVITAENGSTDPSLSAADNLALRQVQWAAQARVAALSSRSVHRLLPGASHFIPMERPSDAVAAVDEVRSLAATAGSAR